ncbi:MAG TPA: peptide deformylase [Candidatus Limnocylindria bacterium]|jgi:peptide deformylase|nr:peptide deformylase [Candidatus Limnocylindria bacterium]
MALPIVKYGDPVLRRKGERVGPVTDEIRDFVALMLDTMADARGVGLAAQQVGRAIQLAVVDVRGVKDRPSQLWLDGAEASVDAFMPLVLIDPVIRPTGEKVKGPEGCLSFPEIYGDVERPGEVEVSARNEQGEEYRFKAGGLLARAIQHEVDHLNGVLFIDRMDAESRTEAQPDIELLMAATRKVLRK